ncbi:MAG: tetratricopeptide repeat protein [Pseudoxanthomonas sp.]
MSARGGRWLWLGALACLLGVLGWRILAHAVADSRAQAAPDSALAWIHGHPEAMREQARRQVAKEDWTAAAGTARALLEREPLEGEAWRILGEAADAQGDPKRAAQAYANAVRLTPRDAIARGWLAQRSVALGQYPQAIDQLDLLLRTHPEAREGAFQYMGALAAEPVFRAALVDRLAAAPAWRDSFLEYLQYLKSGTEALAVADAIHGGLQAQGALPDADFKRWIESLLRRGDWSQAYARWSATLPEGSRLSPVFNGDFTRRPSGTGFDWRTPATPGVAVEFSPLEGARIAYRGRRIDHGGLEQWLLLAPGRYTLKVSMKQDGLRSDRGLEWVVLCAGSEQKLGGTRPLGDRNGPIEVEARIEVPPECGAQKLRLRNAVRVPALQSLMGSVLVTHAAIEPERGDVLDEPTPDPVAGDNGSGV